MASDDSNYSDVISRRRFVELTGVSGAAALAGCGGGGSSTTTEPSGQSPSGETTTESGTPEPGETTESGTPTQESVEVIDQTLTEAQNNAVPTNAHYNLLAPAGQQLSYSAQKVFDPWVRWNFAQGKFVMYALQDWSVDNSAKEVTLKFRDNLKWHNGDEFTAQDVVTQLKIAKENGDPLFTYVDSISKDGKKTVVLGLKQKTNPTVVKHRMAVKWAFAKHEKFKKFLGKDKKVAKFKYHEPVGTGPFKLKNKDKQSIVLKRFADHPDANNVNFTTSEWLYRPQNSQMYQGLLSGELDTAASLFTPARILAQLPDHVTEGRFAGMFGYGVAPNHEDPHLGKRKVRQAIQNIIDRDTVRKNSAALSKKAVPIPCGITTNAQDKWVGSVSGKFDKYGKSKSKTGKAKKLLNQAGYQKQGGTWKTSNGKTVKLPYISPPGWSDWTTASRTIVDQLSSFGFDASLTMKSFWGPYSNGNFRIGAIPWTGGGARFSFPYFSFLFGLTNPWWGGGLSYPGKKISVPAMSGSGQLTLNPKQRVQDLPFMTDNAKLKDTVHKMAWHYHKDLPVLPVLEKQEQTFVSGDEWDVPSEDDPSLSVKWACNWLPRLGKLQAKK